MAEISVIIPTFNRSQFLGETLDSVLAQTYQDWECIVVDDGSKDHTKELLEFYCEKDSRFKYFKRPDDCLKGANACRNLGFEKSKGEFILWYDSDDLMKADKLEIQLEALIKSDTDFCVAPSQIFDDSSGEILGFRFEQLSSDNLMFDYARMKIGWMTPAVLWSKQFLKNSDVLFNEELQAAQEWEFHLRIIAKDPRFCIIEKSLDLIRQHGKSITYDTENPEREWYYFLARLEVYRNCNRNFDRNTREFLKLYLLTRFKEMIRSKNTFVFQAYLKYLAREKTTPRRSKLNALLAIISFKIFGKGNHFLQRIKYYK